MRVTIDYQAINHTLKRHGADSNLVKESGQKAVDYTDIAEYRSIVKSADEKLFSKDDLGQDVILSFKQVNGYAVVVESIRKKGNELAFKSMYFENGSYKNSNAYKNAVDSQKANPSPAPYGYEPHADANTPPLKTDTDIIPQSTAPLSKQAQDYEKIQNKALEYNKLLKELFILFDKNPAAFNKKFEVFKQARNSLIDTLARDFKVAHFTKQLFDPLKMNNALHAAGFDYKAKKFRDGTLRVSGHIPTDSAIQKESRLSDMERERLQLAFAREYNIQDFLNDTHRQDFFTKLSDAARNHFEFLHTYKTDVNKFLYTENRILPTDKITQAKQKLQKEREAFKEFLESNTAPKDAPTPPRKKPPCKRSMISISSHLKPTKPKNAPKLWAMMSWNCMDSQILKSLSQSWQTQNSAAT